MRIRYVSLHGAVGYAVAAKRLILALLRAGVEVTWNPLVPGRALGLGHQPFEGRTIGDRELDPVCNAPLLDDTVIVHMRPEYYPVMARLFPGRRVVGHVAWEADRLPAHWPRLTEAAERVLVPSRFNHRVFLEGGVSVPVEVVPHVAAPLTPEKEPSHQARTVFYTIGTWTARKAIPLTIRAYREAFPAGENVLLIVKTSPTAYFQSRLQRLRRTRRLWSVTRRLLKLPGLRRRPTPIELVERLDVRGGRTAPVELVTQELDDSRIEDLHRRGDCFVSLTRGEGWGIPAFDAAAAGNPVVITGFGGQLDYLDPELAGIVGYDLVPARDDDDRTTFQHGQRWAEPRLDEAVRLLREVHDHPQKAQVKAAELRRRVLESFNETEVVRLFFAALGSG